MGTIKRFEDIEAWQLARELCSKINELIMSSDLAKDYSLRNQISAASGSIMDNIAEGYERDGSKEFRQFLSIAKGSCGEVRSQLYRMKDFGYVNESQFDELYRKSVNISGKLSRLIQYLNSTSIKGTKYN